MIALVFALAVFSQTLPASTEPADRPVDWHMHVSTLDAGDKVIVRTTDGQTIRARVARSDRDSITLRRQGREVIVAASHVDRLERHDGIWEGGKIGGLAGFATGAVMMSTCEPGFLCEHSPQAILACGALAGGFGFGVGLLFDWMVHGDHSVVQRRGTRFDVAPNVTGTRTSVAVRVRF
jgi:hypothetical protein